MGILACCMKFIWCIVCGSILLFTLAVIGIMYLSHTPDPPDVLIHSLNVTGLSASGSSVSGAFVMSLDISAKRYHAYFDDWELNVLYKDMIIASGKIDKFEIPRGKDLMNTVDKLIEFNATSSSLDSGKVDGLESDRSKGSVKFNVEMKTNQILKFNRQMHSPKWEVKDECEDIELKFGSGSNGSDGNYYNEKHVNCSSKLKKKGWWFKSGKVDN